MVTAAPAPPRQYTANDLLELPDEQGFELIGGQLRERCMGVVSSWVAGELLARLREFCRQHSLGWVFPADTGYQCFGDRARNVRRSDVSVVLFGRFPNEVLPEGYSPIPPDLAVEVLSPRDLATEVEEKVEEYIGGGVRLVWVINPGTRTARVHRPDGTVTRLTEDQDLDGELVLPGFRCRLGDIFPPTLAPAQPSQP